jgi:hypothetical protein
MAQRSLRWLLVVGFAAAVGHYAWNAVVGPPFVPEYKIGGDVPVLLGTDPTRKQLYLRREFYLTQLPRRAWVQVLGRDQVNLFVNGLAMGEMSKSGYDVAVVADLGNVLRVGRNVIAVAVYQANHSKGPMASVEGLYELDDGEHRIEPDERWRCGHFFERKARWWFEVDFDERQWPFASLSRTHLRSTVDSPVPALKASREGSWLSPPPGPDGRVTLRREFEVGARPRQGWLRLTATSNYRAAINGIPLDQVEDRVATNLATTPVQRVYDLSTWVREGRNVLSLMLTTNAGAPHVAADLEVTDMADNRVRLGTDENWTTRPGAAPDWLSPAVEDPSAWKPCVADSGFMDVMPWQPRREVVSAVLPLMVTLQRTLLEIGFILLLALGTRLLCGVTGSLLSPNGRDGAVYLALLLPALALGVGVLAIFDPRVAKQDVYREVWLWLAVAAVPLQWGLLAVLALVRGAPRLRPRLPRLGWATVAVVILMVLGFWLRVRDIHTEPLMWDEVGGYNATQGVVSRFFPSVRLPGGIPTKYFSTSELIYVGPAVVSLFTSDDCIIMRGPAIFWGTLVIGVMFVAGRRMFGTPVGLMAACFQTFSPVCITMSNFGRYFSILQCFTVLTMYFFWLTIRGTGLNRRALWLTAGCFVVMYLCWECSALLAFGMVAAALLHRRGTLRPIVTSPSVWAAIVVVTLVLVLQLSFRDMMRVQRLEYGMGLQDLKLAPMWQYPTFNLWYYVWESSWNLDSFVPMLGLAGAALLAIRSSVRRPVRVLLVSHLIACWLMALLVPATAWRYANHLVPLNTLLASVSLVMLIRGLGRLTRQVQVPAGWRIYGSTVTGLLALTLLVVGSGVTLELLQMGAFRVSGYGLHAFRFPNLKGPTDYVVAHMQPGDVVLASVPHSVNHFLPKDHPADFWPQTKMLLSADLGDDTPLPLDHRSGVVMLPDQKSVENVLARHRRVWFIAVPRINYESNLEPVSKIIRQRMDVVYEDYWTVVLCGGLNYRGATLGLQDESALSNIKASPLP